MRLPSRSDAPYFSPYAEILDGFAAQLDDPAWIDRFNAAHSPTLPLRADNTPHKALAYEQLIARQGFIPTRTRSVHDLMNAAVWSRFPNAKLAINRLHVASSSTETGVASGNGRSRLRDGLTLLDEVGVIVMGADQTLRSCLATHAWHSLFLTHRARWNFHWHPIVFGHGLLESLAVRAHKALTGKVLLIDQIVPKAQLDALLSALVADADDQLVRHLRPLPVFGIPGWHRDNAHEDFYADIKVFRPVSKIVT